MKRIIGSEDKQKVLRYAELAFKAQRGELSHEDLQEMESIKTTLESSHEELLELAQRKLLSED